MLPNGQIFEVFNTFETVWLPDRSTFWNLIPETDIEGNCVMQNLYYDQKNGLTYEIMRFL